MENQTNREPSLASIQRSNEYLTHACQCRDVDCRLPSCQKMKSSVQHATSCKREKGGGCPICMQLTSLWCYHAKHCQEAECPAPFCAYIKIKLMHHQLQQRLQEAQTLKRRIEDAMKNRDMCCPFVQTIPGNSNSSNQPSPGAQLHSSQHPPQPRYQYMGIGMNPATGPPVGALQPQPAPQMGLRQQTHLIGGPGNMPNSIENSSMGSSQVMPNPGTSLGGMQIPMQTQAGRQLLQALKSPPSAQQQQQVLAILKSDPQLMSAFIKERTQQQRQQQEHQPSPGAQLHSLPHPPQSLEAMLDSIHI